MSQTAYGLQQTPLPGVPEGNLGMMDVLSFVNTDSTWNMPFGVGVKRNGTDEQGAAMPGASSDEFLGVTMLDHTHDPGPNGTLVQSGTVGTSPGPGVTNGASIGLMRRGRIWVLVETDVAVAAGGAAYCRYSQNGAGKLQLGAFRADGDSSHAAAVNGRFLTAAKTVPSTSGGPGNLGQSAGSGQSAVSVALLEIDQAEVL